MITFTPLSGAARATGTQPLCYLLQIDDVRVLLDCGSPDWTPEKRATTSDTTSEDITESEYIWDAYCDALREYAPTIDLVLMSHGDLAHSGLYAFAYTHWGLKAPAYTTLPVQAMARITTTEDIQTIREEQDVDKEFLAEKTDGVSTDGSKTSPKRRRYVASLQDVYSAFESVNTLRYSQPTHLQGKCQGLTITPYNAGHTLGGTIWKIRSPSAGTVIYAVGINHMREHHLDGTVLYQATGGVFEPLARPDLLITDADRAAVNTSRRKDRDATLIDTITATLESRFSLFLPCDAGPRLLELLVLLDRHWTFAKLKAPICLLSKTGGEMLAFVRSMMEWLGGNISKEDVGEDGNNQSRHHNQKRKHGEDDDALGAFALRFRHLEIFPNVESMSLRYSAKDPKLILAVPASLSHGSSRFLFSRFAETPNNVILLTGRGEEGSLAHALFEKWNKSQRSGYKWDEGKIGINVPLDGVLHLEMHSKVPLKGNELDQYLAREQAIKDEEAAQQAAEARNQRVLEADEDDSDSDAESDDDGDQDGLALAGDIAEPVSGLRSLGNEKSAEANENWANDGDEGVTKQLLSFDIYIKGNVSKATSFFKSVGGQSTRFRMFPYVEKKRRVDDYGEMLDVGMWLRRGKALEENSEGEEARKARLQDDDAEQAEELAEKEPPSKYITKKIKVRLGCRLLFVDLEGLNDGRAVKTILPQVSPRKMIIVHAPSNSTDALIESCGTIRTMTKDIYSPAPFENIQIGQQTNSYSISLGDSIMKSIQMSSFEENEVGFVSGIVVADETSVIPVLDAIDGPENLKESDSATVKPRYLGQRPTRRLPQSTMIGELKLTVLKSRLATVGVNAELVGEGALICQLGSKRAFDVTSLDDCVMVRKLGSGKVELEGNVTEVYYIVRREIYALHATLIT